MADEKKIREILRREYGIKTDQELYDAVKKIRFDIGMFVSPPQYPRKEQRDAG